MHAVPTAIAPAEPSGVRRSCAVCVRGHMLAYMDAVSPACVPLAREQCDDLASAMRENACVVGILETAYLRSGLHCCLHVLRP